jgi:glucosamine-6-phosphate isomerase
MTTKIFPDYETLSRATANLIADYIKKKKDAWICLASGHSPIGVFKYLLNDVDEGSLDLSHCKFFSLDEWVGIDPTDSGSCLSMLRKDFFDPLGIPKEQIEFFNVLNPNLENECDRINRLIDQHQGLDIMLVGIGTNGHIGMNEPGTSFKSFAHIGELAEETKNVGQKYFRKATQLSTGITLGLQHLCEAKLPIIMANGNKKAAIMRSALNKPATKKIPATIAQTIQQGYIMLDTEAASLL